MPDNVILNKGLESRLNSIPIQNGSITVTEDGQNLYVDFRNGVRTKITDVVILTSSTSEVDAPVNGKFYYVNSTKALYLYNNGFNPLVNPDDSGYVVISETASYAQFTFSDDGKTCTSANDLVGNIYPNMKKGTIVIDPVGNVGLFKSYSSSSDTATLDVLVDNRATTTITGYEVYIDTNYEGTGYGTYEKPFNTWAAMEAKCLTDLKNASKPYIIYLKSGSNVTDLTEIDGYNNVVITGESKDTCSITSSSEISIIPGSASTQKLEFKNLSLSFDNTFTIGETSGTIKIGEITFNNCEISSTGTKAINLNLVSRFSFINCYFANNNTIINYNNGSNVDVILFDNCTNLIINQMNTGSDITIKDCLHTTIAQLQSTQDMTFYIYNSTFITRSSFGTYAINLDDANAKCYFISGTLERTNDLVNIASNTNQSIFLGTFNFQDKIPTIADNVLIANPGLDSLQVYDNNNRTYLPTGGNLKEHLDAIATKFSNLDTVTGDLEELVNTIQNAYKDENTFNLETEITGEHRTGDVWKYTGINKLTLTNTITETVQIDSSTGTGTTTTTPQFIFPNAKYFLNVGDQIKVGTTTTMIEVTNIQGNLITGEVDSAINTGSQSLSFDNTLELNSGDRIIWIGNTWDKLSSNGNNEGLIDLGTLDNTDIALLTITNTGIYKFMTKTGTSTSTGLTNEYILFVTKQNYTSAQPSSTNTITQVLIDGREVLYGGTVPGYSIKIRHFIEGISSSVSWHQLPNEVINNLTTTTTGSALDATQGKALNDKITTLDTRVTNAETKLSTVYKYKGSSTVANLPTSNQEIGDVYNLTDGGTINSGENEETVVAGDNVAWDGTKWDKLAGTIDVEPSISEYDTIITSQEEWDTMVASPTWNDAVNILLKVDRIANATATIPNNVKKIVGCPTNNSRPYIVGSLTGSNDGNVAYPNNVSLSNIIIDMGNNLSNVNLVENCSITGKLSNFNTAINTTSNGYTNGQNIFNCIMSANSTTVNNVKRIVGLKCIDISGTLKPIHYIDCEYVIEPTGKLLGLTTTTKTDLVSAINEIAGNAMIDLGLVTNGDILSDNTLLSTGSAINTGIAKFKYGTSTFATGFYGLLFTTNGVGRNQIMITHDGNIYHRYYTGTPIPNWSLLIPEYYNSETGDVTIGGKVNTTGTRDAGNVVIGSGATTVGDNGVIIGSAAEVTGANNKNAIAIGYEAVSAANGAIQIGQGTNSTANTTQIGNYPLLDATGKIVEDRLPNNVGKDLTGETFVPESGFDVTAGQNTEIFNDYRDIVGPGGSGCEGNLSVGDYSHTEGEGNISYGNSSHTQGKNNISIGESSHTEGYLNTSSGKYSHSEGSIEESDYRTIRITVEQILSEDPLKVFITPALPESELPAYIRIGTKIYPKSVLSKESSGGIQTDRLDILTFPEDPGYEVSLGSAFYLNFLRSGALGDNSHKEGLGTIACSDNQHVQGKYNIEDTESKYAHIVGNGSNNASRSNAHTVDWSGNAWYAGDVKVGGTSYDDGTSVATEAELERLNYYGDKDIVSSPESYFTVNSTGETITGLTGASKTQTELVIPYEINGIKITKLSSGHESSSEPPLSILASAASKITKVVIPKSVTTLGRGAFYGCTSLNSIIIPNSVTSIGEHAFSRCSALTKIEIPNNVTSIDNNTFASCSSLKSINIPNSVTSIGSTAFVSCSNLTIYCEQDSYAETFAKSNNIPVVYTAISDIGSGKKYSTIVIGNSASGLTSNDVDYLYTADSDFTTTLTNAINALPSIGGEIKILGGIYTLSTPVEVSSIGLKPIKITGEGKATIITSDTPTDHYITACSCEISECRLETDIRIKPSGYVNIHDCEIAERIYISNTSTLYNIFIHDNNLDYTATEKDFLYLSGSGGIYNFQVYNNYSYTNISFDFLYVAAPTTVYSSSIRNNHCPYGTWNSSTYSLHSNSTPHRKSTMTGNTFNMINFRGNYWCISNNHITYYLYLYGGNYLDVMNNRVDGTFTVASGLRYANITGNVIDAVATSSPYVNLGTNTRFVNNVIQSTNFSTTYIPGYNIASNKWGNNMWADGIDQMVFANGEEIGTPSIN